MHLHHQNTILFVLGLTSAVILSQSEIFHLFINRLSGLGVIGAFIAGCLFVSTFTVATGGLIMIELAKTLSPLQLIIFGVTGAVLGDFILFKFVKNTVTAQITPVYNQFLKRHHLYKLLHTPYFAWTLPVVGAFIIASPIPDELGISLLGLSEMKASQFLLITLISHSIGMSVVVSGAQIFHL